MRWTGSHREALCTTAVCFGVLRTCGFKVVDFLRGYCWVVVGVLAGELTVTVVC